MEIWPKTPMPYTCHNMFGGSQFLYILSSRYDLVAGRSNVIPYLDTCQKNLLHALTTVTMVNSRTF